MKASQVPAIGSKFSLICCYADSNERDITGIVHEIRETQCFCKSSCLNKHTCDGWILNISTATKTIPYCRDRNTPSLFLVGFKEKIDLSIVNKITEV